MLKSKALDIIKTFSNEEFKRFEQFINSPFFNTNKSIHKLILELKKFYPNFASETMTEDYIYGKIYGKGKYSYSAMRNLMSVLIQLCEKFLLHDRINKHLTIKPADTIQILEEYRARKLDNLFNIKCKKFEEELLSHTIENSQYFVLKRKLEYLKYLYHLEKRSFSQQIWNGFLKRGSFELCTIIELLYSTTDTTLSSADDLIGNADDSIMIKFVEQISIEKFLKELKPGNVEENFFIKIYSTLLLMVTNEKKEISKNYYHEIKSALVNNIGKFSNIDRYNILKSLRSYAITQIHLYNNKFLDELYETDKLLIEKVDYTKDLLGWYVGELYSEIVVFSCYKKEFVYAEEFIKKFRPMIDDEIRDDEYGWSKSFLFLEYGEPEKALELLSSIKPPNRGMKISIRNLYLRTYYELEYFEEALSMLDAYKHFVNKGKKFSEKSKKFYNSHHSIFLRLFKYKTEPKNYSGFDLKKLEEDVNKFYFLAGKDWYLKKIKELKKLIG